MNRLNQEKNAYNCYKVQDDTLAWLRHQNYVQSNIFNITLNNLCN